MMAKLVYEGDLRCSVTHIKSNTILETDAPTDNRGKGEKFSPTDLLCVSLASCMITTMGIKATDMGIDLKGAKAEITKHMFAEPRRVGKIEVHLQLPGSGIDEKNRTILERVGDNCPVAKSIHPDIEFIATYTWH